MIKNYFTAASFVTFIALAAPQAWADDYMCPPSLGAVTIEGNLVVDGTCNLNGTIIDGDVKLLAGADLFTNGATIKGNVQDEESGVARVRLSFTDVEGSVQLENVSGAGTSQISDSTINGSVQLEVNSVSFIVKDNNIGSDLQANYNTGGIDIRTNVIDGNLQCQGNNPAPTGGANVVGGNAENQCKHLD